MKLTVPNRWYYAPLAMTNFCAPSLHTEEYLELFQFTIFKYCLEFSISLEYS